MNPHQQGSTTGTMGTASNLAGGGGGSGPCSHPHGPFASLSSTLVLAHPSPSLTWHWGSCAKPPRCCTHPSTVAIKYFYSQQQDGLSLGG